MLLSYNFPTPIYFSTSYQLENFILIISLPMWFLEAKYQLVNLWDSQKIMDAKAPMAPMLSGSLWFLLG